MTDRVSDYFHVFDVCELFRPYMPGWNLDLTKLWVTIGNFPKPDYIDEIGRAYWNPPTVALILMRIDGGPADGFSVVKQFKERQRREDK